MTPTNNQRQFTIRHAGTDLVWPPCPTDEAKEPFGYDVWRMMHSKRVDRWLVDDPDGNPFVLVQMQQEAQELADVYNAHPDTAKVYRLWKSPPEDAWEGDRGTDTVVLDGVHWHYSTSSRGDSSWGVAKGLRDAIVKYGYATVAEILCATGASMGGNREFYEKHYSDPPPLMECEVSP